jgi:hypothetical protein
VSAIFLEKNPTYHSKMKHNEIHGKDKKVFLEKIDTLKNGVDSLMNSISMISSLGVYHKWDFFPKYMTL